MVDIRKIQNDYASKHNIKTKKECKKGNKNNDILQSIEIDSSIIDNEIAFCTIEYDGNIDTIPYCNLEHDFLLGYYKDYKCIKITKIKNIGWANKR